MLLKSYLLSGTLALSALAAPSVRWQDDPSDNLPQGYVTTKGAEFWLDHYPFYFNGANAYWVPQLVHDSQYDQVFGVLQDLGVKVLRTWAFSMLEDEIPQNTNLTYYQYWVNGTSFLNYGTNGLQRLDTTVKYAEKYDIKLILTLTNNWGDYLGMDTYINQTAPSPYHTDFYTQPEVIKKYEDYAYNIIARYRNSSAIFAWELANEPRANGYPPEARPNFTTAELTQWFTDRSEYIKSIDNYHMVCIGDEGYYGSGSGFNESDYIYNGKSGLDFDRNLQIDTIDFGTFHLYPQAWSEYPINEWGLKYIQEHIDSQKKANKPVVMEEFGVEGYGNQTSIYPGWFHLAEQGGLGGIMPWSLGGLSVDRTDSTVYDGGADVADSFDINANKTEIWALWKEAGQIMNAKSGQGAS